MNSISRLFAVASLSLAGFVGFAGCVVDSTHAPETSDIETAPEATVVRYTAEDIAALKPGEFLLLDLTVPNTIYQVSYTDPADLDRVIASKGTSQYIVGDQAPASAKVQNNLLKQVVLSGDTVMEPGNGESVAPPAGGEDIGTSQEAVSSSGTIVVSCLCPCTIIIRTSGGTIVVSC